MPLSPASSAFHVLSMSGPSAVVAYIQKLEEENPEAAAALREKFASEK